MILFLILRYKKIRFIYAIFFIIHRFEYGINE
jgi:hypothetical protein